MHFLVAYDIADPKRLRRVARLMEKHGLRLQKSLFHFEGNVEGLETLLDQTAALMKTKEDVLQAWLLATNQPLLGAVRGTPLNCHPSVAVLDGKGRHMLK